MSDRTAKKNTRERMCIGCRQLKPKQSLIRIVRSAAKSVPDDVETRVFIDRSGKAAGRGAYICPNENCLKSAQKNKSLSKSLRCEISSSVYEGLREAILQSEKEN